MKQLDKMNCKHSILSASASHQWLKAPIEALLKYFFPSESTSYTIRGTILHEVLEIVLFKVNYIKDLEQVKETALEEFTNNYLEYCKKWDKQESLEDKLKYIYDTCEEDCFSEVDKVFQGIKNLPKIFNIDPNAYVLKEVKVDYSNFLKVSPICSGFGTADLLIFDALNKSIYILDAKFGRHFVSVFDNPQLLLYALGSLHYLTAEKISSNSDIPFIEWENKKKDGEYPYSEEWIRDLFTDYKICMGILQPNNINNVLSYQEKNCEDLIDFMMYVTPIAKRVDELLNGADIHSDDYGIVDYPYKHRFTKGSWNFQLTYNIFNMRFLQPSPENLDVMYEKALEVGKWVEEVKEQMRECLEINGSTEKYYLADGRAKPAKWSASTPNEIKSLLIEKLALNESIAEELTLVDTVIKTPAKIKTLLVKKLKQPVEEVEEVLNTLTSRELPNKEITKKEIYL